MKRIVVCILVACILFSCAGCSLQDSIADAVKPKEAVFSIDGYGMQITADTSFREDTGGSFDLQLTNGSAYVSVMAFKYIDFSEDLTPEKVYELQNEEVFNRRDNVKEIEESVTLSGNAVRSGLYSAEKDGNKNYYATYLVDFPEKEVCAWVLITAMPSYLTENRGFLNGVACSLTVAE